MKDTPSSSSAKDQAKQLIATFLQTEVDKVVRKRANYSVKDLKSRLLALHGELCQSGEGSASSWQHVEDVLRYLAFFLADSGRHSQAMTAGVLLNDFRAQYMRAQGRKMRARLIRLQGLTYGYGYRPWRLAVCALIVWAAFALVFALTSLVTGLSAGEPSIIRSPEKQATFAGDDARGTNLQWYDYPYFSAVTMTTLGYGDLRPNTRHWWGFIPCAFAALEAAWGYFLLGLFVAVFLRYGFIHPYARLSKWHLDFDQQVLGIGDVHLEGHRLYDWHWQRYD